MHAAASRRVRRLGLAVRAALLSLLTALPGALPAQQATRDRPPPPAVRAATTAALRRPADIRACVDAASRADRYRRAPVYLVFDTLDQSAAAGHGALALLVEDVARTLRRLVTGDEDAVGPLEPRATWRDARDAYLRVVVRRDGTWRWRVDMDSTDVFREGATLLGAALDTLHASGARATWVQDQPGDSAEIDLEFLLSDVDSAGTVTPPSTRPAFPVFTAELPRTQPVRVLDVRRPPFPEDARLRNVAGTVILSFVVDVAGRPVPATVYDYWDAPAPVPLDLKPQYEAFVRNARRAIIDGRFAPATVAGCAVPAPVTQPFQFVLQ